VNIEIDVMEAIVPVGSPSVIVVRASRGNGDAKQEWAGTVVADDADARRLLIIERVGQVLEQALGGQAAMGATGGQLQ
jgi:hypothetical protein